MRKPRKKYPVPLGPCPKCGKLTGKIMVIETEQLPYYVMCESCGHMSNRCQTYGAAKQRWHWEAKSEKERKIGPHTGGYRAEAKRAAKELGYPAEVQKQLSCAKSEEEITHIMATARERHFK